MSFADPIWLLALALIPLALLVQYSLRRRPGRYAVRFTAVGTLQQVVVTGRGWQRQLPIAAMLAAIAAVTLALARPQVIHRVPIRDASLMLVLDHSGSMAADDVQPTRLAAAIKAANTFVDELPASIRVGAVAFSTTPDAVQRPATNHAAALSVVDAQVANGGTDTGPALQLALQLLDGSDRDHPPSAIVLLSDGAANLGVSPVTVAAQAKRDGVPIYTVALGTPEGVLDEGPFSPPVAVPPDPALMAAIAHTSGGRAFDARSADDLSTIYQTLGRRLSTVAHERDITVYAVIAAALLLLLAMATSVRTSARLP